MLKISAEDLLHAIGDPSFEENIVQLISKNPELEQSLDLAIMRIKSKMPIFKKPQFEKSLTEDEVLNICSNEGIKMSRKNFKGNYLEKELAKYNAAYFHKDVNSWEFDYDYIIRWLPLLLDEKHELRHKIVLLMIEKSEPTESDNAESLECNESPKEDGSDYVTEDKPPFSSLIQFRIGNKVPCPFCGKWTNYSKFAKHAREEHEGTTTKEILDFEENLEIMYEMYLKSKKEESQ